jgi:hypothetical protein
MVYIPFVCFDMTLSQLHKMTNCNYTEIILTKNKSVNESVENVYEIAYTDLECQAYVNKITNTNNSIKFFKKHETKQIHKNMIRCVSKEKNGLVSSLVLIKKKHISDRAICNYYTRVTVPPHNFPSSLDVFDIVDCKRMTANIINNLYLNFESTEYMNGDVFNHIYFNINNYSSIDTTIVSESLHKYIKLLESVSIY